MARIPRLQEPVPGGQVVSFQAPSPATSPIVTERLSNALSQWQQTLMREREEAAVQFQTESAEAAQAELGPGEIAQADESLAQRFQRVFNQRARAVHDEQVKLEAQRTAGQLRIQHALDPDGFGQAWEAYRGAQVEQVRKSDPLEAARLDRWYEAFGQNQFQNLAEQKAARDRAVQSSDYLRALEVRQAEVADQLLNSPDEEVFLGFMEDAEQDVSEAMDMGLLSAAQGNAFLSQMRLGTTREFVRGEFLERLGEGDLGGAQGVIAALQEGRYFEDNDQGRRLANELAQMLSGMFDPDETTQANLDVWRRAATAVQNGFDVSDQVEVLDEATRQVMLHGTQRQIEQLADFARGVDAMTAISSLVQDAPYGQLIGSREWVLQSFPDFSPEHQNWMVGQLERAQRITEEAIDRGDPTAATGEDLPWGRATPEALDARRQRVARRLGMDPSNIPLRTRGEYRQIADDYARAMSEQDIDTADSAVMAFVGRPDAEPAELISQALIAGEGSADIYAAAMVSRFGGAADAMELMRAAGVGRRRNLQDFNLTRDDVPESIREAARAMTFFDPDMGPQVERFLTEAMLGLAELGGAGDLSRRGAMRDLRREVDAIVRPFLEDKVKLANGREYPRGLFPENRTERRHVTEAVDAVLSDPTRLGLRPGDTEGAARFDPVFFQDGSIGFRDRVSPNVVAMDPESNEPVRINIPEIVSGDLKPNFRERARQAVTDATEGVTDFFSETLPTTMETRSASNAARAVGTDPALMGRLANAVRATPEDERGARLGMGLPPDVGERLTVDPLAGLPTGIANALSERGIFHPDVAPYVAAAYMRQLSDKYPSREAAIAAYWTGEDVVDDLIDVFGDDWKRGLPMETHQFLSRMQGND
jgi:hypothetical protein